MKKPKTEKMKEKEAKMKTKGNKLAVQLKGVAKAVATATTVLVVAILSGCQTADPDSRSNKAEYGDIAPRIVIEGSSNVVNVTNIVGDGVYADASGGGDTQSNTPTQTTDVKPDIKVAVGAGSTATGAAGNNPDMISNFVNMFSGWLGTNKGVTLTEPEKASLTAACADGSCTPASK